MQVNIERMITLTISEGGGRLGYWLKLAARRDDIVLPTSHPDTPSLPYSGTLAAYRFPPASTARRALACQRARLSSDM